MVKKINFISTAEIEEHIPAENIPKFLRTELKDEGAEKSDKGGYVYEYKGPSEEDVLPEDGKAPYMESFQSACMEFLRGVSGDLESRKVLVTELREAYVNLEPFVRAKTHYHRAGFIEETL